MATSTWHLRRITREKAQSTAPTEFLGSAKHAITCKRFRTRTSGPAPAACLTHSSTRAPSTETSHPKDASYLRTTDAGLSALRRQSSVAQFADTQRTFAFWGSEIPAIAAHRSWRAGERP